MNYPYKTMKAVSSEILAYSSHKNYNITVFIKGHELVYIEDDTTYFINITFVNFEVYSDESEDAEKATLIGTTIPQHGIMDKTRFHLLINTDLNLEDAVQSGEFSDYEIGAIAGSGNTIVALRSGVSFSNFNIRREHRDYDLNTLFLFPIFLQENTVVFEDLFFNITGSLLTTTDPFNFYGNNILIDSYAMRNGIEFYLSCNYPEANLNVTFYMNNATGITTSERTFTDIPAITGLSSSGHITLTNFVVEDYYTSLPEIGSLVLVGTSPE